jgi:hypothetical protein
MGWSVRRPARPYKVGLSGSPVAWAARGLGHSRRLARARRAGRGQRRRPPGLPPACRSAPTGVPPRAPANWSPLRARPITRCRRARAPGFSRPQCLCVFVSVCLWRARARPISTPVSVCLSVCLSTYVCVSVYIYMCVYMHGTGGPCRPMSVQMAGGVGVCVYIYIYMYVCLVCVWMDATGGPGRHMSRPMTMCVSLQVSVYGARGPLVPPRCR